MCTQNRSLLFSISNPLRIARLTIGVTSVSGDRAEINLTRDNGSGRLIVVEPAELVPPTEKQLNELYLTVKGWTKTTLDGITAAWEDPLNGGAYFFPNALEIQEGRDLQDELAARGAWNEAHGVTSAEFVDGVTGATLTYLKGNCAVSK